VLTLLAIGVLCGAFLYVAAVGSRAAESTRARTAAEATALASATILARVQNYQAFLRLSSEVLRPARWPARELVDTAELLVWRRGLAVMQKDLEDAGPAWAVKSGLRLGGDPVYGGRGGVTKTAVFPKKVSEACRELAARHSIVHGLSLVAAPSDAHFLGALSALLPSNARRRPAAQPILGVACAEYYSRNFYPDKSPWDMDFRARLIPCDYSEADSLFAVLHCGEDSEALVEGFTQVLTLTQKADAPSQPEPNGEP
jgi:hypothetical protein